MATVMAMHWPEVSKEQYEEVRRDVNWEGQPPEGSKFHTAWVGSDGFHTLDLWDSPVMFDAFVQQRLMPSVKKIGIEGEPHVEMAEALSIFAPNV